MGLHAGFKANGDSQALQGIIFTAGIMWYFLQAINIPIHVQEVSACTSSQGTASGWMS